MIRIIGIGDENVMEWNAVMGSQVLFRLDIEMEIASHHFVWILSRWKLHRIIHIIHINRTLVADDG